jgi:glycosyltransferase involved in cell wall biosynthesis
MRRRESSIERLGKILTFACVNNGHGRLKNAIVALQAFKELRRTLPNSRLMMFGEGFGSGEAAMEWAERRGLAENVVFVGSLLHGELQSRIAAEVDVLVHPSLEESFGMVLVEAMALSIPVIAGERSGGTRYVLDEGRAGILTDVRSPRVLGEAMLRCADSEVRRHFGELGFRSVNERFRPELVADAYEKIERQVVG